MARASTPTLLSLDRWARIIGLNPVHFAGAVGSTVFPTVGSCSKVWPQHAWQNINDILSREEVADAIHDAEQDIKSVLGFSPAPEWVVEELHEWPRHVRGWQAPFPKQIKAQWGKVIAPGVRATSAIDEGASVTYSDPDGDGYDELATVTATTTLTATTEVKLYFAGTEAAPEWEIRPLRSKSIAAGTLTVTLDSWLLLDPDLWEQYPPKGGVAAIDVEDAASYVSTVDVYREYNDSTQASALFFWHGTGSNKLWCTSCNGTGCVVCGLTTQEGCFAVIDGNRGVVQPSPASYDADDERWEWETPTRSEVPDQVRFNYYAGLYSQRYLKGQESDPLDHYMAQAIAWLSVARLGRELCGCGSPGRNAEEWQTDMTQVTKGQDRFMRFREMDVYSNPFGTRVGEVKAYQRVAHLYPEVVMGAASL